jgi:nucleoside-diphosphate-sugar epimerase
MLDSLKGKTILVTGSNGFLGLNLSQKLADIGCDFVGIDNVISQRKDWDILKDRKKMIFRKIDITNAEHIENLFKDYDFNLVFHLAAIANPRTCKENFELAFDVNVVGTKNLLRCSRDCDQVVFMSSASVYGEPLWLPIEENHPANGNDTYSFTKIMGENICLNLVKNYGQKISIARNFNTFGIGQSSDYIIPTLIQQALRDKKIKIWNSDPVRDMMYVDNTIDALLTIANHGRSDIYNIGSGRGIQIGQLANILRDSVDKSIEIVDLHKPISGSSVLVANNAKLKNLGWQEKVDFKEGLYKTVKWFRLNESMTSIL